MSTKSLLAPRTRTGLSIAADPEANEDDVLRGRQLLHQYKLALGATRDILLFGAMCLNLEETFTTRGKGNGVKGGGLKGWLAQYAPEIAYTSACRYRDIAEGLRVEFKIPAKINLETLLAATPEAITDEKLLKKRALIFDFIEGKSQRQLLLAFGKGQHGAGGGKHQAAAVKLTPEEELAVFEAACLEDFTGLCEQLDTIGHKWTLRNEAELEHFRDLLRNNFEQVDRWLKAPKKERKKYTAKEFFRMAQKDAEEAKTEEAE